MARIVWLRELVKPAESEFLMKSLLVQLLMKFGLESILSG